MTDLISPFIVGGLLLIWGLAMALFRERITRLMKAVTGTFYGKPGEKTTRDVDSGLTLIGGIALCVVGSVFIYLGVMRLLGHN